MPKDKASEYVLAELNFTSAYAKSSLLLSLSIYPNKFWRSCANQSLHKCIEDVGKWLRAFIHDSQLPLKFFSVIKKLYYTDSIFSSKVRRQDSKKPTNSHFARKMQDIGKRKLLKMSKKIRKGEDGETRTPKATALILFCPQTSLFLTLLWNPFSKLWLLPLIFYILHLFHCSSSWLYYPLLFFASAHLHFSYSFTSSDFLFFTSFLKCSSIVCLVFFFL